MSFKVNLRFIVGILFSLLFTSCQPEVENDRASGSLSASHHQGGEAQGSDDQGNLAIPSISGVLALTSEAGETVPWHLDLADGIFDGEAKPLGQGNNVHIYIFSDGVQETHPEFAGLTIEKLAIQKDRNGVWQALPDTCQDTTNYGKYGTQHFAAAGGLKKGLAKGAILHSVNVYDCGSTGPNAQKVAVGVQKIVTRHAAKFPGSRGIITIPFFGQFGTNLTTLRSGIAAAVKAHIPVVVPAAQGSDSCTTYPAGIPETITVGVLTNASEASHYFSLSTAFFEFDTGSCVDLYAPGSNIDTAVYNSGYSTVLGGTGIASVIASSAIAIHLSLTTDVTLNPLSLFEIAINSVDPMAQSIFRFGLNNSKPFILVGSPSAIQPKIVLPPPPPQVITTAITVRRTISKKLSLSSAIATGTSPIWEITTANKTGLKLTVNLANPSSATFLAARSAPQKTVVIKVTYVTAAQVPTTQIWNITLTK